VKRKSADSKSLSSSFPLVYMWCVCFTCVLIAYLFTTNLKISEVNFPPNEQIFRKKIFTCVIRAFLFRSKRVATSFSAAESTARIAAFMYQRFCRSMCLRSRKSEPTQRGNKSACISLYMHVKQNRSIKKNQKKRRCVCTSSRATASIDSSASRDRYECLC
jgi:hypothetical protein